MEKDTTFIKWSEEFVENTNREENTILDFSRILSYEQLLYILPKIENKRGNIRNQHILS